MINLTYTYNDEEMGWVTEELPLSGSIFLEVQLTKVGRVAIKKANSVGGEYHTVEMSPNASTDYEYTVSGDADGRYLKVITSEEPKYIRYENI